MSWKLRVLVLAMLLAPQAAMALGLGDIRLGSALNEPLSAEIDLVAATPDELSALQAQLASRELFQRYGLERPAYLDTLEFQVGRGQDGRSVLLVRSRESISEPFVSFLVDVTWPRGRLLREYTVLLDPPVFTPAAQEPAAAAIVAPRTETVPARGAPAAAAGPAAPAPAAGATDGGPSTYRVEHGDTLYEIAGALTDGSRTATNQMMIGLFRTNPEAFNGNINLLRAGAILRVPAGDQIASIGAGEAAAEVSRQISAWRAASGAPDSGRLRLVTPEESVADAGTGEPDASGSIASQVEALERDIEQQRRLLELKNQELAELQREMARARAAEAAVVAETAAEPPGEAAVSPEDDVGAVPPAEPAEEPAVAAKPRPEPAPVAAERSFFDSLTDNWLFLLGAAALLLAGVVGYGYVRRRSDMDVDEALRSFDVPATAPVPTETLRLRSLAGGAGAAAATAGADIVVEERPAARGRQAAAAPAGHEETISTEAALDLDQADPLAEADFHMAYGLYDQASDLVKMALRQAPDRDDLKMKLAEIHFVAGETPQFLAVARDLRKSIGEGGDWDRIVIMGRQLAPDDPLFAGGVQSSGVDLSLEGGDSRVDLDLLSTPAGDEGLDLDLGQVLEASDSSAITGAGQALEFNLDEGPPPPGTTQEITQREAPATVELPTIELPSSETPTVESPALRGRGSDTVRERVGGPEASGGSAADSTAEMAVDDLGIDVTGLEDLLDQDDATTMETARPDEPTRIAQHDAGRRMMPAGADADDDGTAMLPEIDSDRTAMLPQVDAGESADIDLDVGAADRLDSEPTVTARLPADQMPQLSELEPVTMSEVGTKLDLARAYMDMGDPDGARNILQEVLAEGSTSQKQEARRLIDSLPGA